MNYNIIIKQWFIDLFIHIRRLRPITYYNIKWLRLIIIIIIIN